ncbi:MAG: hypothetical protein WCL34_15340 [Methylococcaceae bacterium]
MLTIPGFSLSIFIDEKSFNEIQSGNNPYHYVMANKYWKKWLQNKKYSSLILKTNCFQSMEIPYLGFEKQVIQRKHFDKKPVKIFAIRISISHKFFDWSEDLSKCMRTNKHYGCYGILWTCSECNAKICCAEGSHSGDAHLDNLCDECWQKCND